MREEKGKDAVASVAAQVRRLSTGGRATLRRMDLTQSVAADAIVVQMLVKAGVDAANVSEAEMDAWRTTAFAAAVISGTAGAEAHDPTRPLGGVLLKAGYSPRRLERLASDPEPASIRRALRFLASAKTGPADMREVHALAGVDGHARKRAMRSLVRRYHAGRSAGPDDRNGDGADKPTA